MKSSKLFVASILVILELGYSMTASRAHAQTGLRLRYYTTSDGLPSKHISQIVQDGQGYLWLRQNFELTRFDGYNFKVYRNNPDDSLSNLGPNLVGSLLADPWGNLWINGMAQTWGNGALIKYDRNVDGFVQYKPDLDGALINSVAFDRSQPLAWLAGRFGRGLFSFNLETKETKSFGNRVGNRALDFIGNMQDRGTDLLLGTRQGLWTYNKATNTFSRPHCNRRDSTLLFSSSTGAVGYRGKDLWLYKPGEVFTLLKLDSSLSIVQRFSLPKGFQFNDYDIDKEGVVWFATDNGLLQYDPKVGRLVNVWTLGDAPSSTDSYILTVTPDHEMNIWVSFSKGLGKLQNQSVRFHPSWVVTRTLGCNEFTTVRAKDTTCLFGLGGNNTLWMANFNMQDSLKFIKFEFEGPGKPGSNFIKSWKGRRYFWIATWGRGVIGLPIDQKTGMINHGPAKYLSHDAKNPNTLSTDNTWSIYEDEEENLWVGTFSGLNRVTPELAYGEEGSVLRFNHDPKDSNSISHDVVRQIIPGEDGSFWFATEVGVDMFKKSAHKGEIGNFEHVFNSGETVQGICKTSEGVLYVGTIGGLYEGIKQENRLTFIKSPLFPGKIDYLVGDRLGRLWFVGFNGIVCYDRRRSHAIRLSEFDGLHDPEGQLFPMVRGTLAFGNGESVLLFDPQTLRISEDKVTPILTSLNVNNRLPILGNRSYGKDDFSLDRHVASMDELVLDYEHNNFSLEFAAMELKAPEKNLYRHRLEGYDPDWIETDSRNRSATYTNLPSGTYTFKVKASNHHGVWSNNERTLKVVILPPPWRTWWAYTGYSFLAVGLLLWARRNIVKQERLQANLKLEHLELEKAKEVDKVKTSFFTNISHEFRTPLTLIKGPVADLLEKYTDDPKTVDKLKLVEKNSDLLLRLINQLLDLAKLESGSLKVELTAGDAYGFMRAIASGFESHARQKGVTLQVEVPQEPATVMFDKDKLETILINLVNNAIKFTAAGGTVTVSGKLQAPNPKHQIQSTKSQTPNANIQLVLSVTDTGIGIPEDQRDKVFERFHQVSESHKEVGTGIGLALVKELVTLMGGTIKVESEMGKGSTFTVSLPVQEAVIVEAELQTDGIERTTDYRSPITDHDGARIANNEQRITNAEVDGVKPQILVVEDNVDVRGFIIDSLGDDYSYLEAENGKEGLHKATTEIPDLIISDVMMPEMDGITMAGKIKEDRSTSHIPLILLTAKSTEESKLSGLSSGADDYLTKPFNKQELLLKVRNSINRQIKLKEMLRNELLTETPREKVLSQDEQFLQKVKETIVARMSDEQLSVESLADDMGMSRVQLYRKVSALTGLAANELIRKLRMQRAAQLLAQNWGPVSQVAYEVGFSNLSYFSKVFKEEFGVLPSEYVREV